MIELTTPEMVERIVTAYADRPVTKLALLNEIADKALLPETKAAALAALTAHYVQEEETS